MLMITLIAFLAIVILSICALFCARSPMLRKFFSQNFGEFRTDCRLFFNQKALKDSITQWKSRVNVYSALKTNSTQPGASRLDYLSSDRLRILDAKFTTLLQVQTLLGVMLTLTTSKFWEQLAVLMGKSRGFLILFALPFALWFITIIGCLMAVGNIRWGELWKANICGTGSTPADAEEEYVNTLIEVAVVRTAMLRMLSALALLNFVLSTLTVAYLVSRSFTNPANKSQVPPANVLRSRAYQFPPGQACSDDIDGWIEDVVDSISHDSSRSATLSASADALPLRQFLRKKYGNDIGLAYARGICAGDRIKKKLFSKGWRVEMDIRVRDLSEKERSSASDRTVTITWLSGSPTSVSE